jgi:hypothetical protein
VGRPCTICTHNERAAIEAMLQAGQPLRDIAGAYGTSKTALHRHWQLHIAKQPLATGGKPPERSGTRVPAVVRWGLWAAGILAGLWVLGRAAQTEIGEA